MRTAAGGRSGVVLAWSLFAAGLTLRLLGLPFNGMHDLSEMVVDWGGATRAYGLAHVLLRNYGLFSYAVFGNAFLIAEHMPRFWWAPYKLFEVGAEILLLIGLRQALPPGRRIWALLLYWVNPWFILHGGWQGFWDAPHTLLALSAGLCSRRVRDPQAAWTLVGVCLMSAAMFKPQGLFYFVVPAGIYLALRFVRDRSLDLAWFALGVTAVALFATTLLLVQGGSLLAIPLSYLSASTAMPNLCNGCLSGWRPVAGAAQAWMGQEGPTWALKLPRPVMTAVNLIVLPGVLALIGAFAWRRVQRREPEEDGDRGAQIRLLVRGFGAASLVLFAVVLFRLTLGGESAWVVQAFLGGTHARQPLWPLVAGLLGGRYPWDMLIVLGLSGIAGALMSLATPAVLRAAALLARRAEPWRRRLPAGEAVASAADPRGLLSVLAFASLAIPQLGTGAHINHSYAALVLLIPIALGDRRIALAWGILVATHFYSHLASYGLGLSSVIPQYPTAVPLAQSLIARMTPASFAGLSSFQDAANHWIEACLPREPVISVLSAANLACTLVILRGMLAAGAGASTAAAAGPAPAAVAAAAGRREKNS